MPFYEYECSNCKFYIEEMQKISDPPLEKCPSCGKKALKKLVSAPNFRLKGGGWYETDFKGDKENRRNLAGAEAEEAAKTESAAPSESPKTETAKSEPAKAEATTADSSSKTASRTVSKPAGGSRSAVSFGLQPSRMRVASASTRGSGDNPASCATSDA